MVIGKSLTLKYDFAWQESDPAGQLLGYRLQSVPFCRFCNAKHQQRKTDLRYMIIVRR